MLTLVLALVSCSHECEYVADATLSKAPTCTEDGYNVSKCECGEQQLVPVPKLGHDYVETVVAPTCQAEGHTENVCSRCQDKQISNKTPIAEHTFVADPENNKAPTCTEKGYEAVKCSVCGTQSKINQANYPATGHTYVKVTDWTAGVTPSCTVACTGFEYEKCEDCGFENPDVPKTSITYAVGEYPCDEYLLETKEATCQQEGQEIYVCRVCSTPRAVKIADKKKCDFSVLDSVKAEATCYNEQIVIKKCKYADHTENNTIEETVSGTIKAHTPNVQNADCATDKYCVVCAEYHLGAGVVPTAADFATTCPNANPTDNKCTFCIYEGGTGKIHLFASATGEHLGGVSRTVDPTCMQTGRNYHSCANMIKDGTVVCGFEYSKDEDIIPIDPDAHAYGNDYDKEGTEDKITPATCVDYAYKSKTCINCDINNERCKNQITENVESLGYAPHTFTSAEHTGTIVCENPKCKIALYDTTYSKDVIYDTTSDPKHPDKVTEDFGDGSSLTVTITGTKTEVDQDGNPIEKHIILDKTNPNATVAKNANGVVEAVTVIYIEKTGDIAVTVKVNGDEYTADANGYIHLNNVELEVNSIELTSTFTSEDDSGSAKIYFYSRVIIGG